MIHPELFTLERLLAALLDTSFSNRSAWVELVEIVPHYMPPFPNEDTRPACVVRFGESFLRYSKGPRQGHVWDVYGDDYHTPELALIALLEAPVPPGAIDPQIWDQIHAAQEARKP